MSRIFGHRRRALSRTGLLRFGGELLLKKAVEAEITRYLGRGFYEHFKGNQESTGYRNGMRATTIDTPIGQVTYDRQLLTGAPDFKSQYHVPYMRGPEEFADALVYRICPRHAEGKKGFRADDLVKALWSRLRNQKLEMITQLELGL